MMKAALLQDPDIDPGPVTPVEEMTLDQLITAANYGETSAVSVLEERMRNDPAIWRERGSLTQQLLSKMLQAMESNHDVHPLLTRRFLDDLSAQLVRPEAHVLERIMGERVLLAHANLHLVHYLQLSLDEPQLIDAPSAEPQGSMNQRLNDAYHQLDMALNGLRNLLK